MTNDARVLAAIYENGNIHFGSNSILQGDITSTVMLSTIKNVQTTNPKVEAKLLNIPGMEFGYPSMAYTGVDPLDHKVMYSFSHCRIDSFPGTSVIYKDAKDNFSKLLIIKEGESIVNAFSDSIERWGDYTNMQKLYQYENQAFLTGSYGKTNRMATWLAKLEVNDTTKGTKPTNSLRQSNLETTVAVYPNPIKNSLFQVNFEIDDNEDLSFDLYDNIGRKVVRLLDTKGYKGKNEFSFRTNDLPKGQYILQIKGDKTTNIAKTVLVE